MWTTSFQPFLIHHLRVCIFLKCTLCRWDSSSGEIVAQSSTSLRILYQKSQLISGLIYVFGISLKITRGNNSIAEKCQGVVFLLCMIVCLMARWHWPRKGQISEPCQMLNACFKFEKVLIAGYGKGINNLILKPNMYSGRIFHVKRKKSPVACYLKNYNSVHFVVKYE